MPHKVTLRVTPMTYYMGIDTGKSGAFAVIDSQGTVLMYSKFESWADVRRKTKKYRENLRSCAIEKVASKSAQGVKSVFTFGMNYGGWLAFLELANISHSLIPPIRWQRMFLGTFPKGESKIRSVDFINRKYPHVKLKKKQHGISDAICLALYTLVIDRRISGKRLRVTKAV